MSAHSTEWLTRSCSVSLNKRSLLQSGRFLLTKFYDYDGDDYYRLFPQMVTRLDSAEDSEQANEDRAYLEDWFLDAFGTNNIKYNFANELDEVHASMEESYQEA